MTKALNAEHAAVLHLVCGKIAAGKSTLCDRLVAAENAILICEDVWLSSLYPDEIQSLPDYVTRARRLKSVLTNHIMDLLHNGVSVVLDFPFNTPETRAWGLALANAAGSDHQLHYLDVSDEICKARLRARNASGEHPYQTTDAQFDEITRYFVVPTAAEGLVIVTHDDRGNVRV